MFFMCLINRLEVCAHVVPEIPDMQHHKCGREDETIMQIRF